MLHISQDLWSRRHLIFLGIAEQICSPYWNPLLWDVICELIQEVITDFDRLNTPNRNGPEFSSTRTSRSTSATCSTSEFRFNS